MSISLSAAISAKASIDGDWCGTKPHPHPHFDLGSIVSLLDKIGLNPQPLPPKADGGFGQHATAAFSEDGPRCGNEPRHFPFPTPGPNPLADLVGGLSHQVMNAVMGARAM